MSDTLPTPSNPSAATSAGDPNATPAAAPNDRTPVAATLPVDPNAAASAAADPAPAAGDPAAAADPAPVAGDWPEDWREKYAGGDEKALKRLQRYGSPKAALDALFNAQNRISSGEVKTALKPDATPEEKAAWRAENGIPESPDKYDTTLKDGLVLKAGDKPVVDGFLKLAHERNMRQEDVTETLSWWADQQMRQEQEVAARDHEVRMQVEVRLRQEYGPEYQRNMKIANDVLTLAPEGVKERLLSGRTADGVPIGNDPDVIRWLVQLGREINPVAAVAPGTGTNAMQTIETELGGLRKMMGDKTSDYWKGPNAQKNQARYRELISAVQKGR